MRVFVLTTGRAGSSTLTAACRHMTNFTAGHETRTHRVEGRLDYPDDHIEADPRLAWFLGSLGARYDSDTAWVHLRRSPDRVAESFEARWERQVSARRSVLRRPKAALSKIRRWWTDPHSGGGQWIASGFAYAVLQRPRPLPAEQRRAACDLLVETMTGNIDAFLAGRENVYRIDVESFADDFEAFWVGIGAEGDLPAALGELEIRHNAR